MKLCCSLGKTKYELRQLVDSQELLSWKAYDLVYGLPLTRIEHVIAIAGAVNAQVQGGKVKASDLIPRYTKQKPISGAAATSLLHGWAASHNHSHR
jgi:ribose 1,5-bisphosphokinase PhnN